MVGEGRGQKYLIFPGVNGVHHSEAMAGYVHMIHEEIYTHIYLILDTEMSFFVCPHVDTTGHCDMLHIYGRNF